MEYSKTCLKWALKKKTKIGFQDRLSLNAGQTYCRMLQGEHSAIFSTFIKLPFVINIFVLSIFEWPLKTGFTEICVLILIILFFFCVEGLHPIQQFFSHARMSSCIPGLNQF